MRALEMRALALAAVALVALGGCHKTRTCKAGTLLLGVDWPETTDSLIVAVSVEGAANHTLPVPVPTGTLHGTLELDFAAYPVGQSVTVVVTAYAGDTPLGTATSDPHMLAQGCDTVSVSVVLGGGGDAGVNDDLGDGGGPIGCTAATDCPKGQACDTTAGTCTMTCSATQPCNGGCCNGTMCAAGDKPDACALGQPMCGTCVGKSTGSVCIDTAGTKSCGCTTATDCPANLACNTTTHTCGPACDMNTPCNGGCCSAATNGTCQTGTLDTVCGNSGGLCAACASNQNGHKCIAMTGGGQCGCGGTTADCPATSTACTNNLCVNACSPTMLCQSGCCSSSGNGTCQLGNAAGACGAAGSVCQSCAGNANGSACLPSGACGCTKASDCPANHACDTTQGKCTTACNSNQACNGGCCSAATGGTCQTGTVNSLCGNSGVCAACPGPTTCASYSCNGASCVPSYAGAGTGCNDNNACTYSDVCNGSGSCVGTAVHCPAGNACTYYTCNGGSTCDLNYQPSGTLCGRGDTCCTGGPEACNGSGACVSNGCCNIGKCCTL
jgi:hypothetical protein